MNPKERQQDIETVSNRFKKLAEANRSLVEIESLDELFLRFIDLAKEVTTAESSLFFLYNSESRLLEIVSVRDDRFGDKRKSTVKFKMGEGVTGWVAQNRKAVLIEDAQKDSRFSRLADKHRNFTTRSLLSVPLVYREELLGVLTAVNARYKPFFDNEDLALFESFADLAAVAIIRARLLEQRIEQDRLRTELKAAAKIQKLFWPKVPELGVGSHVWAHSEPAGSVGGDLYDVIPMPDKSWLVYVADVAGKGLPAALMMAALSAKVRSIAPLHHEVAKLLANVNDTMYALMSDEGFFATMLLSKYWPETGRVQIARAGHPYPLWVINHGVRELPKLDGIPIGIELGAEYKQTEFVLSPGESILLITDGVTEAENEQGGWFGNVCLFNYFKEANGPPWAEGLLERMDSWRGNAPVNDDLTMVEIWRDPPR
ncbi:MAG: GAF domain-containing SpoIIE family protein phosphatase [Thermodesulfobacteriota bacterium]